VLQAALLTRTAHQLTRKQLHYKQSAFEQDSNDLSQFKDDTGRLAHLSKEFKKKFHRSVAVRYQLQGMVGYVIVNSRQCLSCVLHIKLMLCSNLEFNL